MSAQNLSRPSGGVMHIEAERAIQEVQAAMTVAKRFPRDEDRALDRIRRACSHVSIAENATYEYQRGGDAVLGPSIRLAEVMAQAWGNFEFGVRELSSSADGNGDPYTEAEAYAWDMETNTRDRKIFRVSHRRVTRNNSYIISDPRDLYEHVANSGARRKRACVLAVIPIWVQDEAMEACRRTLDNEASFRLDDERLAQLLASFKEHGVDQPAIEGWLDHPATIDEITRKEYIRLRRVYGTIRDGIQKPWDFFDIEKPSERSKPDEDLTAKVNAASSEPSQEKTGRRQARRGEK